MTLWQREIEIRSVPLFAIPFHGISHNQYNYIGFLCRTNSLGNSFSFFFWVLVCRNLE